MNSQSKFNIGDSVWYLTTSRDIERRPCPDCNGTRQWDATSGTGERFKIPCARCAGRTPDWLAPLAREVATHYVKALTIGSVRLDTAERGRSPWSYMCVETGVGSGSIYYETDLFDNGEDAEAEGARRNAVEQAKIDEQPRQMRSEDFARLSLQTAIETGWREEIWHAWTTARDLREALEEFFKDSGGDPSREELDILRDKLDESSDGHYEWRKPNALGALLSAVREGDIDKARSAAEGLTWKPKPAEKILA